MTSIAETSVSPRATPVLGGPVFEPFERAVSYFRPVHTPFISEPSKARQHCPHRLRAAGDAGLRSRTDDLALEGVLKIRSASIHARLTTSMASLVAVAALAAAATASAADYSYRFLNYGDGTFTIPRGINNNGMVVGSDRDPSGTGTDFSPSGLGINDAGTVVGQSGDSGFSESNGVFTAIDVPGATRTIAFGVNDSGEIVGDYLDSSGNRHGFIDVANMFTTIDPPGSTYTVATKVNNSGEVVGYFNDAQGVGHGFTYENGVFTQVDFPGSTFSGILGVNDLGQLVGDYSVQDPALDIELPYVETNGVFTALNVPGQTIGADATDINDSGVIIGLNTLANGNVEGFIATPSAIPEPGAWGLLLVGFGGLGAALRGRRFRHLNIDVSL